MKVPTNLMKFTMDVMARAAAASSWQQGADGKTTENNAKLQSDFFKKSTQESGRLKELSDKIRAKTDKLNNKNTSDEEKEALTNEIASLTTEFQYEQTRYQAAQNQYTTLVDMSQTQLGQNSKNLEQLLSLAKANSDMMAYLAGLLRSG